MYVVCIQYTDNGKEVSAYIHNYTPAFLTECVRMCMRVCVGIVHH